MPITTEITVQPGPFAAAVAWAAKWSAARPAEPVHGGLTLTLPQYGNLVIGAFSENVTARAVVDCDYPESQATAHAQRAIVSARLLAALAGTLGTGTPVVISGGADGGSVTLASGRFIATLPTLDENAYPAVPGILPVIGCVTGDVLAATVKRAAAATLPDSTPLWTQSAYLALTDDTATIMATDRNRVVRVLMPWKMTGRGVTITPVAGILAAAAEAMAGPDQIDIGSDGVSLSFSSPTRSLTMGTLDTRDNTGAVGWPAAMLGGQLDADQPHSVVLDRNELAVPIKRARIVRGAIGPVRFSLADGTLTIGAARGESSQASAEPIDVQYAGPEYVTGFNPDFLAAALNSAPGPSVRFSFTEAHRPVTLTCDTDPSWRHLLMPIRLR